MCFECNLFMYVLCYDFTSLQRCLEHEHYTTEKKCLIVSMFSRIFFYCSRNVLLRWNIPFDTTHELKNIYIHTHPIALVTSSTQRKPNTFEYTTNYLHTNVKRV